jgi:uncharacterized protein (TIGR02147 family)
MLKTDFKTSDQTQAKAQTNVGETAFASGASVSSGAASTSGAGPVAVMVDGQVVRMPSVFDYQDYRTFLKEWLFWKKQVQPGYSATIFARKAGIKAHTLLGMVIRGERNLSFETIRHFGKGLGLTQPELAYLEKLVLFNQARTSEDKAHYFNQVFSASRGQAKDMRVLHDYSDYFASWYVVAIRELVELSDFNPDAEWISRKLKRKITRKQAQEAWETVVRLGLVEKVEPTQEGGAATYRLKDQNIDVDLNHASFVMRKFHREHLKRAEEAIDGEPMMDRELHSATLAVSAEDLAMVRAQVKEYCRKLLETFPRSSAPKTHLIAVNLQMLTLTQTQENPGSEKAQGEEK